MGASGHAAVAWRTVVPAGAVNRVVAGIQVVERSPVGPWSVPVDVVPLVDPGPDPPPPPTPLCFSWPPVVLPPKLGVDAAGGVTVAWTGGPGVRAATRLARR